MDECIHLISPPAACAVCQPRRRWNYAAMEAHDGGVPSEGVVLGTPPFDGTEPAGHGRPEFIKAEHHSTCPGCGSHIVPGDPITRDDDIGFFVCGGCAPRAGIEYRKPRP
jgi:hypothetical protein